jgi:hypothetical protein
MYKMYGINFFENSLKLFRVFPCVRAILAVGFEGPNSPQPVTFKTERMVTYRAGSSLVS